MLRPHNWNGVAQFLKWKDLQALVLVCKSCYCYEWLARARFHENHKPNRHFKKLKCTQVDRACAPDILFDGVGKVEGNPVIFPNTVTHLTLGFEFDQPLTIPDSVIHLTFGYWFNQPVTIDHCANLAHLTFGSCFNHPVTIVHCANLTHLKFGDFFNQFVMIPNSVIHLKFGYYFDQPLTIQHDSQLVELFLVHTTTIFIPKHLKLRFTCQVPTVRHV